MALAGRQVLRAVLALVLEEMSQVIARQHAEEFATTASDVRELEVDKSRPALIVYQPIRFLGEIVVRDVGSVELAQ